MLVRSKSCQHGALQLLMALAPLFSLAQVVTPVPSRITHFVDESSLVTLQGNVPSLARSEYDLGAAPLSMPFAQVSLVLKRSPEQDAALKNYLASVQQAGSPNYHKWLTPEQFGRLYGPAEADIQTLTAWLQGRGFTVSSVSKGLSTIHFSGTVAQIQETFHVAIHSFNANGDQFYSNTSDPQIPSALAPVVAGVANLNTIRPKPLTVPGKAGRYDPSTHKFLPMTDGAIGPRPQYTVPGANGSFTLFVVPGDAATIYNTPNKTLNANFSGNASYDGTGVTIGIAGQSNIDTSIVANYRKLFLGDAKVPTVSDPDAVGTVMGEAGEVYLDNEISGGLAPGASLHLYVASNVANAAEEAVNENTVDVQSVSYTQCEAIAGNAVNQGFNGLWQQAAAQGITVLVASGDAGSADCDPTTDDKGNDTATALGGLSVSGLASTPYDTAVGGTDYYSLEANFAMYVDTSAGVPATFYRTAKSYIPESSWNESTQNNTTLAGNVPWTAATSNHPNIYAGSGGASNCAVQPGTASAQGYVASCTSGYPKPSWQTGPGVPADKARDLPDVAMLAGSTLYGAAWAVCDSTVASGSALDCTQNSAGAFAFNGVGGTSAATPAFAGIFALVVQKTGQRQGLAAPVLYNLFNGSSSASVFHDVVVGNNAVPCTLTTAPAAASNASSCVQNAGGSFFESGYETSPGYDLATGLGSVNAAMLVANWASPTALLVPSVTLAPSAATTTAEVLTAAVTVSGPGGKAVPTGNVVLSAGEYDSQPATLSAGSANFTVPANTLKAGSDPVSVTYTPDDASATTYFSGSAVAALTVTAPPTNTGTFTLSGTAVTVSTSGGGGTSTITATPTSGFATTGMVNLSCVLTTPPSGATMYYPACSLSTSSIALVGTTSATATAIFTTVGSISQLATPAEGEKTRYWYSPAAGAALSCIVFLFGIPARKRSWKMMAGLLVLVTMAGAGCGGNKHTSTNVITGTIPGDYIFTITGTAVSASSPMPVTTTVTVTVK